jgi:hypothetical protein
MCRGIVDYFNMTLRIRRAIGFLLLAVATSGCTTDTSHNELVMCPGASIAVGHGGESFEITAKTVTHRVIQVASGTIDVNLDARRERWNGSLGLYAAHGGLTGPHVSAEEGQQFFDSMSELQYWLRGLSYRSHLAYTSDGLVVKWSYQTKPIGASGPDAALTFEIWQVFVKGKKPNGLSGAHDEYFNKISLPGGSCASPSPYVASAPGTRDGHRYSGRALDFLRDRGLNSKRIEKVIAANDKSESDSEVTYYASGDQPDIFSVTMDANGTIVFIQ